MPFTHSRATGISGALRQRAWGSLRADPRYSPATAVIADQKLTSSKQSGTWQERGYQGPKMFGKVLKELEGTGSLSLQVCSVPSGDSILAVGGVYQGSRCMGLVHHSCLHNGTALQSAPPHSQSTGSFTSGGNGPGSSLSASQCSGSDTAMFPSRHSHAESAGPVT